MLARLDPVSQMRWLPVKNTSGVTIPAFAAMKITGIDTTTGTELVQVAQPTSDGQEVIFNGDVHIGPGLNGIGCRDFPLYALYENADGTPAVGETWGAAAGSWKIRKGTGRTGLYIYGGATGSRVKVVGQLGGAAPSPGGGGPDNDLIFAGAVSGGGAQLPPTTSGPLSIPTVFTVNQPGGAFTVGYGSAGPNSATSALRFTSTGLFLFGGFIIVQLQNIYGGSNPPDAEFVFGLSSMGGTASGVAGQTMACGGLLGGDGFRLSVSSMDSFTGGTYGMGIEANYSNGTFMQANILAMRVWAYSVKFF